MIVRALNRVLDVVNRSVCSVWGHKETHRLNMSEDGSTKLLTGCIHCGRVLDEEELSGPRRMPEVPSEVTLEHDGEIILCVTPSLSGTYDLGSEENC